MKMSDEIEVKPESIKRGWTNYQKFVVKNWFVFVGIIIILGLVLYDVANVQVRVKSNEAKCNAHWREQLSMVCPKLGNDAGAVWVSADFGNITLEE